MASLFTNLEISESLFHNGRALNGGAIYVTSNSLLVITESELLNN